jgi:hypothetical protein
MQQMLEMLSVVVRRICRPSMILLLLDPSSQEKERKKEE